MFQTQIKVNRNRQYLIKSHELQQVQTDSKCCSKWKMDFLTFPKWSSAGWWAPVLPSCSASFAGWAPHTQLSVLLWCVPKYLLPSPSLLSSFALSPPPPWWLQISLWCCSLTAIPPPQRVKLRFSGASDIFSILIKNKHSFSSSSCCSAAATAEAAPKMSVTLLVLHGKFDIIFN